MRTEDRESERKEGREGGDVTRRESDKKMKRGERWKTNHKDMKRQKREED